MKPFATSPRGTSLGQTLISGILGVLTFLAWGCADTGIGTTTTSCLLPTDQTDTLNGRWLSTPIPIALHQGDFSTYEASQITAAVDTWNSFTMESMGKALFDDGGGTKTSNVSVPSLCGSTNYSGSAYTQPIVIYKDATWPSAYHPDVMAQTSYCWNTGSSGTGQATAASLPVATSLSANAVSTASVIVNGSVASVIQPQLRTFTQVYTEVNYQYFFVTAEVPDLQTIILHELGHVLGLNHSCNDTTTAGFPTCTGAGANTLYQQAVMYPVFGFYTDGTGQQRRSLNSNDEGRANCLYQ